MKSTCLLLVLFVILTACVPVETPQATQAFIIPTATQLPGEQKLDACGFTINHPAELKPINGQGYQVMFQAESEPDISVFI